MLFNKTGVQMYHYSYVFPNQVKRKIKYYKDVLTGGNAIDDYFDSVYIPWVTGGISQKQAVEDKYNGVHEFKPNVRGACRTEKFHGEHPESIIKNIDNLESKISEQLKQFT